jgi:hypothetical protein
VLFQFPEGWLDIAAELFTLEWAEARTATVEIGRSRAKAEDRLRQSLHWILDRGEACGALMPNLRAFNYFWGDVIDAAVAPARDAAFDEVAALLRAVAPGRQTVEESRLAAEALAFFAFDLVCAPMYRKLRPDERAAKLDAVTAQVIKGISRKA